MATYQKRGERWRAIIRKSGHRPVSKSFRTKAAARRWAQETEDGIESRQFSDPRDIENITIGDLIDRYIEEFAPKPTKKGSLNIINATLESIPEAEEKIAFDKFHVAKYLGEAVDKVRRQEHKALMSEGYEDLKGSKYDWLYNPENMTHK